MRISKTYRSKSSDDFEVIANLSADTNTPEVLGLVASWHEVRTEARHRVIANALRRASGRTLPVAANDNQPRRRRAA